MIDLKEKYNNKRVLIIGGLGFMGSNLAHRLVGLGAKITILEALLEPYGGNWFNIHGIKDEVEVHIGDVRRKSLVEKLIKGKDFVFNFAAQISYIDSLRMPVNDLEITCRGALNVLEACRKVNKKVRILYPSSRMVYGLIHTNPVNETHSTKPLSLYGIHKLAVEQYHQLYSNEYGLHTIILRIPNPYGIRQQIKHSKYSLVGWFIRLAMEDQTIKVFGNGEQIRDFVFSEDLTQGLLLAGAADVQSGEVYNIGSGNPISFIEMVRTVLKVVSKGKYKLIPWPDDYESNETGDYVADITKAKHAFGWAVKVSLKEGIERTFEYYKKYAKHYF